MLTLTKILVFSYSSQVVEDVPAGTKIGEMYDRKSSKVDPKSVQFSITEDTNGLFKIQDNNLILARNLSKFILNSADVTIQAKHLKTGETKTRTITVVITRSDLCYNNGKTCGENARCVAADDLHVCQCVEDFTGDGYVCQQIDECQTQNGNQQCGEKGVCQDEVGSFSCVCKDGYSGKFCEMQPEAEDVCKNNRCKNKAACDPVGDANYTCVCAPGWRGDDCGTSINDCQGDVCGKLSNCKDGHMTFVCSCPEGKVGHRCQYSTPDCEDLGCGLEDICTPNPSSSSSACSPASRSLSLTVQCQDGEADDFCTSRFLIFIERYALLPAKAESISVSQPPVSPNVRKERSTLFSGMQKHLSQSDKVTAEILRSQKLEGAPRSNFPYVVSVGERESSGGLPVSVVVMDSTGLPFTKDQIVSGLTETCNSIGKSSFNGIKSDLLTRG